MSISNHLTSCTVATIDFPSAPRSSTLLSSVVLTLDQDTYSDARARSDGPQATSSQESQYHKPSETIALAGGAGSYSGGRFGSVQTTISELGPILHGLQSRAPQGNPLTTCYSVRFDISFRHISYEFTLAQTFQNLMRSLDTKAAKMIVSSANCMAPVLNHTIRLLSHCVDLVNNIFGTLLDTGNTQYKLSVIDRYIAVGRNKICDAIQGVTLNYVEFALEVCCYQRHDATH